MISTDHDDGANYVVACVRCGEEASWTDLWETRRIAAFPEVGGGAIMRAKVRMEGEPGVSWCGPRVWLDGVELKDVRSLKLSAAVGSMVELQLTLIVSGVDVEGEAEVEIVKNARKCPSCTTREGLAHTATYRGTAWMCTTCGYSWDVDDDSEESS